MILACAGFSSVSVSHPRSARVARPSRQGRVSTKHKLLAHVLLAVLRVLCQLMIRT